MQSSKIQLQVSNQKAYVWNVEDASRIRNDHHITGTLGGTLPTLAQQNLFLGLPLILLPEEAVYLVRKEAAVICDAATAHHPPNEEELHKWQLTVQEDRMHSLEFLKAMREESARGQNTSEEAQRKRREREMKRKAPKVGASSGEGADVFTPETEEVIPVQRAKDDAHTIVIPGTSEDHPWIRPEVYDTVEKAQQAGVWSYPDTPLERAKCAVFADLIEKGYYMGPGLKFGGDWLVYPGDQLRYHSHFVATVYLTAITPLTPMQIVAYGRLGTATKKSHLLCGWDEETGKVDYFSIIWSYFG